MENNTAKHFVLQLGSIITLYLSVSFLLVLLFSIINLSVPDATESYWQLESNSSSVRLGIAFLLVFFPTYIALTRRVNVFRRKETNASYLGLTKWLMYLSLLVGGGVILGDLVAIILAFLEGELTTRFILKALALLAIVGAAFYYYLQDARGYWLSRESASKLYAAAMAVVVTLSVALGFFYSETPNEVREMRLDQTQVQNLQEIQWRIEESFRMSSGTLPSTLEEAYGGFPIPEAPEDREAYTYEVTERGFNLCATFSRDSNTEADIWGPTYDASMPIKNANNWQYKEGRYCFERVTK
jgi:hypothetical protein